MKTIKARLFAIISSIILLTGILAPASTVLAASGDTIVYITKTGECYHKDGCPSLSKSKIKITLQEAVDGNYRACSKCKPPTLDVATTSSNASTDSGTAPSTIQPPDDKEITYIGNSNTKKFHNPTCASVTQINPENRIKFTCTRDEIISQGYDPCKKCNP